MEIIETPTGTQVLDWIVPNEWNVRAAWIEQPGGTRVVDFADSNLHVLNYSAPIDATVSLERLREHVFTHPDDPELVPHDLLLPGALGVLYEQRAARRACAGRLQGRGRFHAGARIGQLRRGCVSRTDAR